MARIKPAEEVETQIIVGDDGTLLEPPIAELYAMAIVDGEDTASAWRTAGGANSERHLVLKGVLDTHAGFKARVDALAIERAEVAKDKIFGQAVWMIAQGFREARAKRDRPQMLEYAKLRLQAAQGVAKMHEKTIIPLQAAENSPQTGAKVPNGVGKPTEKSPQSTRSMDDIRSALRNRGLKVVAEGEDGE